MAIIKMTLEEAERYMTPEKRCLENEAMNNMPITYDEDCPRCSPEKLARFHRVNPLKPFSRTA